MTAAGCVRSALLSLGVLAAPLLPAQAPMPEQPTLQTAGFVGAGPNRAFVREVRVLERRADEVYQRFLVGDTVFHPADYLPIVRAPGVDLPTRVSLRHARIVYGGVLGAANAVSPFDVRGKVAVFLPPLNVEGSLVPEVWRYQELLEPYLLRDTVLAIIIVGLELLSPHAEEMLRAPAIVPLVTGRPRDYPPLVLVRRQVASFLLNNDVDDVAPGFLSRHLGHDYPTELSHLRFRTEDRVLPQRTSMLAAERPGRRGEAGVLLTSRRSADVMPTQSWLPLAERLANEEALQAHPIRVAVVDSGAAGSAALSLALLEEDGPRRRLHAHVHVAPAMDRWRDPPCAWTVRRADIALTVDPSVPPVEVLRYLHAPTSPPPAQPTRISPGMWRCPSAAPMAR